jgi:hypothetical protein
MTILGEGASWGWNLRVDERGTDKGYTNEIYKAVFGSAFLYTLVYNTRRNKEEDDSNQSTKKGV